MQKPYVVLNRRVPEKLQLSDKMKVYWEFRGDITLQKGILMKGSRLIIPEIMQEEMIQRIHDAHQGIAKCRERAKLSVWWIGLSKQLEHVVKSCQKCIENSNDIAEPMISTDFPSRPWPRVASDLFQWSDILACCGLFFKVY